jgi:hypothetical protein
VSSKQAAIPARDTALMFESATEKVCAVLGVVFVGIGIATVFQGGGWIAIGAIACAVGVHMILTAALNWWPIADRVERALDPDAERPPPPEQ